MSHLCCCLVLVFVSQSAVAAVVDSGNKLTAANCLDRLATSLNKASDSGRRQLPDHLLVQAAKAFAQGKRYEQSIRLLNRVRSGDARWRATINVANLLADLDRAAGIRVILNNLRNESSYDEILEVLLVHLATKGKFGILEGQLARMSDRANMANVAIRIARIAREHGKLRESARFRSLAKKHFEIVRAAETQKSLQGVNETRANAPFFARYACELYFSGDENGALKIIGTLPPSEQVDAFAQIAVANALERSYQKAMTSPATLAAIDRKSRRQDYYCDQLTLNVIESLVKMGKLKDATFCIAFTKSELCVLLVGQANAVSGSVNSALKSATWLETEGSYSLAATITSLVGYRHSKDGRLEDATGAVRNSMRLITKALGQENHIIRTGHHIKLYCNLARTMNRCGDRDEAKSMIQKALSQLDLIPDDDGPVSLPGMYVNDGLNEIGAAAMECGLREIAKKAYRRAWEKAEKNYRMRWFTIESSSKSGLYSFAGNHARKVEDESRRGAMMQRLYYWKTLTHPKNVGEKWIVSTETPMIKAYVLIGVAQGIFAKQKQ